MKKILIAISDNFSRNVYSEILKKENFEVIEARNLKEALDLSLKELPDIILADVLLSRNGELEILKLLKEEKLTQRIPVVVFSQMGREEDRIRAMELEAKDFIVGASTPPLEVVLKIKIHLGEEKTYSIKINEENFSEIEKLAKDLEYSSLKCQNCGSLLNLFLIRDFSKGKNYFKVSLICPKCIK